ncbi:MAG: CZB domain-containing protein [Gallionella sp.]|nr:CZB domain-containing protein [Gallionella sp.]
MTLLSGVKDFLGFDHYRKQDLRERLNLIGVAETHILWKIRLGHHVHGGTQEPLETALVGQDAICLLGNWIRGGEFEAFHGLPAFQQLRDAHQKFHDIGELIVCKLREGDSQIAAALFEGEYTQSLRDIIHALTVINKHLQEL